MPGRRFLIALGGAFFLIVLIRTAWLSELSYLTLRTIEHAATGHGIRWNVSERVQAFDHPLWMLLLLCGRMLSGESYYTTFVISLVLSAATAVLVLRSAPRLEGVVLATMMLSLSWAFVTFSTSGLEGPLAHLLVASFCIIWLRADPGPRDLKTMAWLAGLAAVTQAASLLITGPALMFATLRGQAPDGATEVGPYAYPDRATVSRGGIVFRAGAPILVWVLFAAFYYGTPVPMPVIAEWTEGAGLASRLHAASRLLGFVLRHDPITLTVTTAAIVLASTARNRGRPLAWGVVAYSLMLAVWAGDGMPGRWLALPCLVSTLILLRLATLVRPAMAVASAAALMALAAVPALVTIQSDVRFGTPDQPTDGRDTRVADYPATGLLHDIRQWYPPHHPEATRGGVAWQDTNRVKTSPHPAFFGFAAGYGVHVIDRTGRADPLLARLRPDRVPAFPAGADRRIPDGYEISLPDRDNAIADPAVATYYDRVRFVTRGPLGDPRRLMAALRLAIASPPEPKSRVQEPQVTRVLSSELTASPPAGRTEPRSTLSR
jgi:arabinofuranosyltransferase